MYFVLQGADFSKTNLGKIDIELGNIGTGGITDPNAKYTLKVNVNVDATIKLTPEGGSTVTTNGTSGTIEVTYGTKVSIEVSKKDYNSYNRELTITRNRELSVELTPIEDDSGESGEPETPVTPTNYTFTIIPDPTSATVTLTATGYSTVSGTGNQSITVANGTKVDWSVSADGYTTRTGDWTVNGSNESKTIKLSEISTEYVSYLGTEHFTDIGQRVQWNESGQKWYDTHSGTTSAGTELIPVSSEDSIWINKLAVVNGSLASGGFYDMNKQFVAPLYWRTFGIDQVANASAKFVTPENPVTIASVEEEYNCSIAYVKFTAWAASDVDNTGIETTEARVYYANGVPQEPTYTSYIGEDVFSFNKQSFTDTGYTTSGSSSAYSTDYIAITPQQGVWLQYIFTMSDAHNCVGLFDSDKTFIKSITRADFGLESEGKFQTPSAPVKISDLDGTENVAYVRFVAWTTSDGGRANTEARIYSY